jgi:hypothetical protein
MKLNRRSLLASIPALLAASKAQALSLDDSNARLGELVANRCGQTSEHARMMAEAEKILIDAGYGVEDRKKVLAAFDCPVCGCKIATAKE